MNRKGTAECQMFPVPSLSLHKSQLIFLKKKKNHIKPS